VPPGPTTTVFLRQPNQACLPKIPPMANPATGSMMPGGAPIGPGVMLARNPRFRDHRIRCEKCWQPRGSWRRPIATSSNPRSRLRHLPNWNRRLKTRPRGEQHPKRGGLWLASADPARSDQRSTQGLGLPPYSHNRPSSGPTCPSMADKEPRPLVQSRQSIRAIIHPECHAKVPKPPVTCPASRWS